MGYFDGFKLGLINALNTSGSFTGVAVMGEYQPAERESPLRKRCLCVGFYEIASDAGSAQYLGTQSSGEDVYGKGVTVTASFKVYVPLKEGGLACHAVFSLLADFLLLRQTAYRVQSLRCGEIRCDPTLGAYTLTALAQIKTTALCTDDTPYAIEEIEVKRSVG